MQKNNHQQEAGSGLPPVQLRKTTKPNTIKPKEGYYARSNLRPLFVGPTAGRIH